MFQHTGLQFLQINSFYQLWSMKLAQSPLLASAERFLMMPDLFHWMLTGAKVNEFTNATTTQLFNPRAKKWSHELCDAFELPCEILGEIVPPGTSLGRLRPEVARETGLSTTTVIAPGTHDTASAVMAVPAMGELGSRPNWCYISSGTWSLMGVEMPVPVVTEKCLELNFTNEGGIGGTTRLLKNIAGLWLVQECLRIWRKAGRAYDWETLNRLSAEAKPLTSLINPDDPVFLAPPDMPNAIVAYCTRSGQRAPDSHGAVIRCAVESLALRYRQVLGWIEELIGGRIETIHIVGGGTKNRQLCQMTANACGRQVVAGPVEATSIGNVMVQALAEKEVATVSEARAVIAESFSLEEFEPEPHEDWDAAYEQFQRLTG
jgi:rhamnulokinase